MRTELMARHLPPLPEMLPETPLPLVEGWLAEARQEMRNATSMALATERQVDGPVTVAPDEDSDRYWDTRPLDARIAAIASDQSQPIASRAAMLARVEETSRRLGAVAPRPPRWGGYRVWAERVEMWVGQPARVHDRAQWTRALEPTDAGFAGGQWSSTRLQP